VPRLLAFPMEWSGGYRRRASKSDGGHPPVIVRSIAGHLIVAGQKARRWRAFPSGCFLKERWTALGRYRRFNVSWPARVPRSA